MDSFSDRLNMAVVFASDMVFLLWEVILIELNNQKAQGDPPDM